MIPPDRTRSCGDCNLCCTLLSIHEHGHRLDGTEYTFLKPALQPCKHLCGGRCAIYDSPRKPYTCRTFHCKWREGFGTEDARPDRTGWVVTSDIQHDERFGGDVLKVVVYLREEGRNDLAWDLVRELLAYHDDEANGLWPYAAVMFVSPDLRKHRRQIYQDGTRVLVARLPGPIDYHPEGVDVDEERSHIAELMGPDAYEAPTMDIHALTTLMKVRTQREGGRLPR